MKNKFIMITLCTAMALASCGGKSSGNTSSSGSSNSDKGSNSGGHQLRRRQVMWIVR